MAATVKEEAVEVKAEPVEVVELLHSEAVVSSKTQKRKPGRPRGYRLLPGQKVGRPSRYDDAVKRAEKISEFSQSKPSSSAKFLGTLVSKSVTQPVLNTLSAARTKFFECNLCNEKFYLLRAFMEHSKQHRGEGVKGLPFACQFCDTRFANSFDAKTHESGEHSRRLPYRCNTCNRCFRNLWAFSNHKDSKLHKKRVALSSGDGGASSSEVIHDVKPLASVRIDKRGRRRKKAEPFTRVCLLCHKVFHRYEAYRVHLLHHQGILEPYKCKRCPLAFRANSQLHRHTYNVHLTEKSHPYRCPFCGYVLNGPIALRSHQKTRHGHVTRPVSALASVSELARPWFQR